MSCSGSNKFFTRIVEEIDLFSPKNYDVHIRSIRKEGKEIIVQIEICGKGMKRGYPLPLRNKSVSAIIRRFRKRISTLP